MTRQLLTLTFTSLLLVACSTTKPAPTSAVDIDPYTDPTIVGAVDEAVYQGTNEAAAVAPTARRIGRVAGVLAAVLGGPETESVDDLVDRYRQTRDVTAGTIVTVAATKGAVAGAKRGYELDLQFAELHQIEGVEVTRPFPDQLEARLSASPTDETLANIAAVFAGREQRAIDIEAADNAALDIRDALIDLGVPASSIDAHRNDELQGAVLHIGYGF
jgi:hypothetical protein